ncbi:MAG TPA: hypothetical protein VMV31_03715 [Terriglobales bacterium]|nr:hypothetical protein [Terriglobales bacterium]
MTSEDLLTARAARREALAPAAPSPDRLWQWVRELGLATLPELSDEALAPLEASLAALHVIELWLWPGILRYCAVELLDYIYVCVGDRHPRSDYQTQAAKGQLSWLAAETFELLLAADRPLSSLDVRERLGAERTSTLGVDRALVELAHTLKVLRVGRRAGPGSDALWRPLVLALPDLPACLDRISHLEAAGALASQYLDVQVCETEDNLALFFAPLMPASRLRAALHGLEATRQVVLDSLDGRPAWRLRQPK